MNPVTKLIALIMHGSVLAGAPALGLAAVPETTFDGTWLVESVRLEGNCIERNSVKITIRSSIMEGVIQGRAGIYYLKGQVNDDGSFESRLEGKSDSVTIRGLLTGESGEGRWASRSKCTGTWTLQRIQ
jgi:hypothetical protein